MNFVQKLIDDTNNGDWDFFWKYNEGSDTFTLNKPKHYLSGLNFTTSNKIKSIVFPNGSELFTTKLDELEGAVRASLLSTMNQSMNMYLAGKELTPEEEATQAEQEKNKSSDKDLLKNAKKRNGKS
jgi:hypothetical protein